jgi:hypothetical protein
MMNKYKKNKNKYKKQNSNLKKLKNNKITHFEVC